MGQSFIRALRSELEPTNPIAFGIVLLALYFFVDTWTTFVGILIAVGGLAFLRAGLGSTGAPQYVSGIVIGGGVAVGCAVIAVAVEFSWLYVAFAAVGSWLCLDGLSDRRHGIDRSRSTEEADPLADSSFRESMQYMSDARAVLETLRESPVALTPAQLSERTGYSRPAVDDLLEELADGGPIERVGDNRYTVDESKMGPSSLVRDAVWRLCRPFSVLVPGR